MIVEAIGWTLLHSLWQGAVIAGALCLVLRLMNGHAANSRYLTACMAMCLLIALPTITLMSLVRNQVVVNKGESGTTLGATAFPGIDAQQQIELQNANSPLTTAGRGTGGGLNIFQLSWEKLATSTLAILVWIWFLGVLFRAVQLTRQVWGLQKLKTLADSAVLAEWRPRFSSLCQELGISYPVRLIESATADTAFTLGWLKPIVVIPASAFLQLAPNELEAIIKHELAHIKRHDYLVNLVQIFIETVLFYHPATWWISAVIRREREFACDDAVVQLSEDTIVYARALANLEHNRLAATDEVSQLRLAAGGKALLRRIKRIVEPNNRRPSRLSALLAWSSLLIVASLLIYVSSTSFPSLAATNKTHTKKMAVGFVAIPPFTRSSDGPDESTGTYRQLIEKLKVHQVPAVGFVLGAALADGERLDPAQANVLRMWSNAGLEIGIGGFNHINFYDTPFEEYVAGVEKNERIVKQTLTNETSRLRYFSYPFLNTGKTEEDTIKFESWLKSHGMAAVKYTFDNQEWMYSFVYDKALKSDTQKAKEIRAQFLEYMSKMLDHFEAYSQEMFGRDINQTLVLTPSQLVVDSADELFGMMERRGYKFVSMAEAQQDEAYETAAAHLNGRAGISWFERWQMARGKKLRDEPAASRLVWNEWKLAHKDR